MICLTVNNVKIISAKVKISPYDDNHLDVTSTLSYFYCTFI